MLTYNEKMLANSEKMLTMQIDLATVHQSLNDTTFAFLSEFRNVVKRTSKQTWLVIVVAIFTLAINGAGIWLTFKSSDDLAKANQQMLAGLTDRLATIASQPAAEREAMLAEQRRLVKQFISITQARIEQQAAEQRAAIQDLKGVLSQKEAVSGTPIEEDIGPP